MDQRITPNSSAFFRSVAHRKRCCKKMLAASKEKGCEQIAKWTKGVRNHIYWCSTSTIKGYSNLVVAKWKSFIRHVSNKHSNHPDPLFTKCAYEELEDRRKYIKVGKKCKMFIQSIE